LLPSSTENEGEQATAKSPTNLEDLVPSSTENVVVQLPSLAPDNIALKPSATENEGEQATEMSPTNSEDLLPSATENKSPPTSEEAVEKKVDVERYLEEVSSRCTDPILMNFASYCIVIPMSELLNRKLLCKLQIHSPYQIDWYNVSFAEYTRDKEGNMGFLERNKRMRHKGDLIVGVNGIHLKGWEGNDVLELMSILLKDINTTELRLTLRDKEIAEKYSKISEEEGGIEIMSPSNISNNIDTQEIEAMDVSPTKSEPTISKDEPALMDYEDNFEASQHNDEEVNVEQQQLHYIIAPGSEVDENVMAHVEQIFYEEFRPIYEKAREGRSQMVDKKYITGMLI
jgi:hypothetical protein